MATVFIEARPKGRPEGSPITDYVVEDHADHPLETFNTQHEAIDGKKKWSLHLLYSLRHGLTIKKVLDHWRAV